jgi:tetratricopeptide (TPR) repeat protein
MTTRFQAWAVAALCLCATIARGDTPSKAKSLYEQGLKYYNVGEYKRALDAFKEGYLVHSDPVFLFNIGQSQRQLHDPENAIRSYRAYLREAPTAPNRVEVERLIGLEEEELRRKTADAPPTGVLPSEKQATATTGSSQAEAPAAASNTLVATPAPAPKRKVKPWVWGVIAGAGAVVIAGVIVLGVTLGSTTTSPAPSLGAIPGN